MKRVLVTGSRELLDPRPVYQALYFYKDLSGGDLIVRHGFCPKGADRHAHVWCSWFPDIQEEKYPADWNTHGKAAGHLRNQQMIDAGGIDYVLAFPRGEARGTVDCVKRAWAAKLPVIFG